MKFIHCVLISFIICAALLLTENTFCKKMNNNNKKKENNHQINERQFNNNITKTYKKKFKTI